MSRYDQIFKDRMMGLLAAAKSLSGKSYDSMEDMSKDCMHLVDLLAADADRIARKATQKPEERDSGVEGFIRENGLDRGRFEAWLGMFFPEVKTEGIGGITPEHGKRILDNPATCLERFREWLELGDEKTAA